MHGGAPGSGAPLGNMNARKHGAYTRAALNEGRMAREHIRASRQFLKIK